MIVEVRVEVRVLDPLGNERARVAGRGEVTAAGDPAAVEAAAREAAVSALASAAPAAAARLRSPGVYRARVQPTAVGHVVSGAESVAAVPAVDWAADEGMPT